jgi:tRNASer (uridine44-2'-O)-methyltransferase
LLSVTNPLQFEHAVSQLIHHPEYNSTLILRSEVIEDSLAEFPNIVPALEGLQPVRNIHRKLLPRRPTRDAGLEQHCTLYAPSPSPSPSHPTDTDADTSDSLHPIVALVLTPILSPDGVLPYYHPTVTHLAFRFVAPTTSSSSSPAPAAGALRIEAVPLPRTSLDTGARLYRTCLSLLETLHRYGWGALTHYKKRVAHDVIVPREMYQDLYLVMRERYKHLVNDWREVTDPLKHVFEVRRTHPLCPTGGL